MTATNTTTSKSLIKAAEEAWRQARAAKAAAKQADEAVKQYLFGRRVYITGSASPISGGTIHSDFGQRKYLRSERVVVTAVFYYFNEHYRSREDSVRVITADGKEYQLELSAAIIEDIEEGENVQ